MATGQFVERVRRELSAEELGELRDYRASKDRDSILSRASLKPCVTLLTSLTKPRKPLGSYPTVGLDRGRERVLLGLRTGHRIALGDIRTISGGH